MNTKLDFAELSASVRQLESCLTNDPDRLVRYLVMAYQGLVPRLSKDFVDRRDQLLARNAALRLVHEIARQSRRTA